MRVDLTDNRMHTHKSRFSRYGSRLSFARRSVPNATDRAALLSWAAVLAWMTMIFTLSATPGQDLPSVGIPYADKFAHCSLYLVTGFLLMSSVSRTLRKSGLAKIIILVIIIASLYGVLDELHQVFVPGRDCDVFDFIADFIGANLGVAVYRLRWPMFGPYPRKARGDSGILRM